MERLKPLNDLVFKKLLGEKGREEELRAFLSAVLGRNLTSVTIVEGKELTPEVISDKLSILDVRATTDDITQINIEVQLTNQYNMGRRSLFYWSRLFASALNKGGEYKELPNVITINILDFPFVKLERYHTVYHLWEDNERYKLTDALEIHFIEMPKFLTIAEKDMSNPLHRWLLFLNQQTDDNTLKELIEMDRAIKKASNSLKFLETDKTFLHELHLRDIALSDYNSAISYAKDEGRQEGETQRAIEIARNLLDVLDDKTISEMTDLPIVNIEQLRDAQNK